jgi:hypothetical protein
MGSEISISLKLIYDSDNINSAVINKVRNHIDLILINYPHFNIKSCIITETKLKYLAYSYYYDTDLISSIKSIVENYKFRIIVKYDRTHHETEFTKHVTDAEIKFILEAKFNKLIKNTDRRMLVRSLNLIQSLNSR